MGYWNFGPFDNDYVLNELGEPMCNNDLIGTINRCSDDLDVIYGVLGGTILSLRPSTNMPYYVKTYKCYKDTYKLMESINNNKTVTKKELDDLTESCDLVMSFCALPQLNTRLKLLDYACKKIRSKVKNKEDFNKDYVSEMLTWVKLGEGILNKNVKIDPLVFDENIVLNIREFNITGDMSWLGTNHGGTNKQQTKPESIGNIQKIKIINKLIIKNKVVGYRISDGTQTLDVKSDVLKQAIRNKKLEAVNATLTSDNRLIVKG